MRSKIVANGNFEVYEDGTVFRIKNGLREQTTGYFSGPQKKYVYVSYSANGKQYHIPLHRLVAEAFLPNPDGKPYVRHKDENGANNQVDNLEWISCSERAALSISKTMKTREKKCVLCGGIAYSKDHICKTCKDRKLKETKQQKQEQRMQEQRDLIRSQFANIDFSRLSELQKRTVEFRLQGMTLDEIALLLGCSKQCVYQRLRDILLKCNKTPQIGKCGRKSYLSAKNRLAKKLNMLEYLENEIRIVSKEIEELEPVVRFYEQQLKEARTT